MGHGRPRLQPTDVRTEALVPELRAPDRSF